MKFGGHETFYLRPGWITKGLFLVAKDDRVSWSDNRASDALGVGRNMAKSIGWWLGRAGLTGRSSRSAPIELTEFGRAILESDPFVSRLSTVWFLHVALTCRGTDDVFGWFFREWREPRFSRDYITGSLKAKSEKEGGTQPNPKSIERDVAVLLQSYATPIPSETSDPEDNLDCPLRALGLLAHKRGVRMYERRQPVRSAPPAAIAATLSLAAHLPEGEGFADIPLDMIGPIRHVARVFAATPEEFVGQVGEASEALGLDHLSIRFLAGGRVATVRRMRIEEWYRLDANRLSPLQENVN